MGRGLMRAEPLTCERNHLLADDGRCHVCEYAGSAQAAKPDRVGSPPVDLAAMLEDARAYIRQYVVLSDAQADTVTLWVAHTHAFDAAEATPYLSVTSAEKKSGKTRLLEVLVLIVSRPWLTGRVTPAALYRRIHVEHPTLLLDESDSAFRSGEEYAESLRGILNTGHRQGGATTVCVGQGANMTYGVFSTFSAKAIAGIGRLPDTVEDRAISIVLKRKAPGEKAARFRWRTAGEEAAPLKERLEAWGSASVETLAEARPDIPLALDDRAADGWEVLLAIADAAGGDWSRRARAAALALSVGDAREDESLGVLLLSNIRDIYTERGVDRLTCSALAKALVGLEEAPWADIPGTRGKALDTRRLGWRLKRFQIKSRTIRLEDGSTAKGYMVEQFEDEWARYLPCPTLEKPTPRSQPTQTADTDTGDVSVVTEVSVSQDTGGGSNGQRLYARSLWEDRGRPDKPRLRDGVRILDVETFIATASSGDLTAFIDGLEGAA